MKIRKKYLFYVLSLTSAILAAIVVGIDTTIRVKFIQNPYAFGIACFLVGIFITFLITIFLSIPIRGKSIGGTIIDPSFNKIRLIKSEEIKYHIITLIQSPNNVSFINLSFNNFDISIIY